MKALTKTDFHFDGQKSVYHGKVRDVYDINDDLLVMIATDRISAFDVVLPKGIPFKLQLSFLMQQVIFALTGSWQHQTQWLQSDLNVKAFA